MAFAPESRIQEIVHALEQGGLVKWIYRGLLGAALVFGYLFYLGIVGSEFKGISTPEAMDQAQISRELARGHGFSTQFIRPLAIAQICKKRGTETVDGRFPDTYNMPLYPLVNALPLLTVKSKWQMDSSKTKDAVYIGDKVIAGLSLLFFLAGVYVSYRTAIRLFDRRLALLGAGLVLVSDYFWQFSLTGLPQMLMLLLFSGATYALVRALEAQQLQQRVGPWVALAGLLFGLLTLTHGVTFWIFVGAVLFVALQLRPRGVTAALMAAVFLIVVSPWLIRNYSVSGSPFGLGMYSLLEGVKGDTASIMMRSDKVETTGLSIRGVGNKVHSGIVEQFQQLFRYFGWNIIAPVFFVGLLHLFKRPETSAFRWGLFAMWVFAALGMCLFGINTQRPYDSNQLHVLFVPLMTFYGLAFVLVLWSRLAITARVLRIGFLAMIFLICAIPMIKTLLASRKFPSHWPPYFPPVISMLNQWTEPGEAIASDVPWAVAWYADRRSLWMPMELDQFTDINDFGRIGGPVVSLFLTPQTGNAEFLREVVKGEYKAWAPFILRNVNLKESILKTGTPLPLEGECMFYADRIRWPIFKTDEPAPAP